jgi:hypothetical protein
LPYSSFIGNSFLRRAKRRVRGGNIPVSRRTPLKLSLWQCTEYSLRGIMVLPYFIPLHCISTFSCPIEVGLPLYERTCASTHAHAFT